MNLGRTSKASILLLALFVVMGGTSSLGERARAQASLPPNVLIIVTDDQRRTDLSEVMPATAQIFGQEGVDFNNGYATTPLCCPSRASIFSGRYAHNHGVRRNRDGAELDEDGTIERYLHDNDYYTAIFGKYLLGRPLAQNPPYFDEWAIFRESTRAYYNSEWNVNGSIQIVDQYSTHYISDLANTFIQEREGLDVDLKPWLMFLTTAAPHKPFTSEPRYRHARVPEWTPNPAVSERNLRDKPPFLRNRRKVRGIQRLRAAQLRTLMSVDDMVEEVFRTLRETGEDQDTIAFFLSDNGYLWGEHRLLNKRYPYVPSVKVPFMMRWPGHVEEGVGDHRIVANIDIAPTVLEAAGVSPDPAYPIDGKSLLGSDERTRLLLEYWDETKLPTWASTKTNRYQYIEYYNARGEVRYREFYNLRRDPWQLTNLFRDRNSANDPDHVRLAQRLARDRACIGATCP